MAHQRQVIAEKVQSLLVAGSTLAGARVHVNRFLPLRNRELPAILIYPLSESVDDASATTAPRELARRLDLAIVALVAREDEVEIAMNVIASQVEAVMAADPYLGGEAGDSILKETLLETDTVGDRLVGGVSLTYEVLYRTLSPEPPTELDNFESVGVRVDLGGLLEPDDEIASEFVVQEPPDES